VDGILAAQEAEGRDPGIVRGGGEARVLGGYRNLSVWHGEVWSSAAAGRRAAGKVDGYLKRPGILSGQAG
jgi:hypothetical protein